MSFIQTQTFHCNFEIITEYEYEKHILVDKSNNTANTICAPKEGTLNFSSYVGLGPASTLHPKKYQDFQAPKINI